MAKGLHALAAISPVADWATGLIFTHQLQRRTRSGSWMTDHVQGCSDRMS
ncbi:hypothetical protein C4K20_4293 [Pseudomonas chlororaphis subsp. aurantiaca]|nr:hypothetical protein C4K20_4293 [Pseudomonas chlororaphis subsp. aurantiaca]AZD68387.1 hypothetical protein C4K17_4510 [Pseudomonas chlororaphis subsp. aurantiaca]AZD74597.1 hypothetical protein C4K16_4246 [Pseudomonas chlororaphis subsp. aurantiaca]AZD80817.1 hypothetical protein C4K15_4259 [Pseudomonas chlororaphis subsp. aurantiaca]